MLIRQMRADVSRSRQLSILDYIYKFEGVTDQLIAVTSHLLADQRILNAKKHAEYYLGNWRQRASRV